jgi:hypothetical protein
MSKTNAGTTIYIVKFTTTAVSDTPGVRYSSVHNTYAIIANGKCDIDSSIERYRIQEMNAIQKFNFKCEVITKAKITAKHKVFQMLKA